APPAGCNAFLIAPAPPVRYIWIVPPAPLRLCRNPIQPPPGRLLTGTPILRSIRPEVLDGPAGDPVHGPTHQKIPTTIDPPTSTSSTNRAIFTPGPLSPTARSSDSVPHSGHRRSPILSTPHRI